MKFKVGDRVRVKDTVYWACPNCICDIVHIYEKSNEFVLKPIDKDYHVTVYSENDIVLIDLTPKKENIDLWDSAAE